MTESVNNLDLTNSTCRICLQNNEDDADEMIPIFQDATKASGVNDLHIHKMIEDFAGIELSHHHRLSTVICPTCKTFLHFAYKFRTMCRNSQNYLHEYVINSSESYDPCLEEHLQQTDDSNSPSSFKKAPHDFEEETNSQEASSLPHSLLANNDESNSWQTQSDNVDNMEWQANARIPTGDFENAISAEQKHEKTPNKKQTNQQDELREDTTNLSPSKTLGISSDGTAVIMVNKSAPTNVTTVSEMPREKKKQQKRIHVCDICGNIYDRRYSLVSHMRRHRNEKPFACEICGQAFHCNFELSRHIRKHTGLRPFACTYCKRTFGDRSTLLKHERIHRNERPYICKTCGKDFTYANVLKSHQLTHTGEKPYNCELCGKRFSRSHHLRAHLETLLHQNDPKAQLLIKQIKRVEDSEDLGIVAKQ